MRKGIICLAVAACTIFTSAAFGEEIKAGGGGAPMDGYLKPVKEAFEKSSGIKLNLNFSSATAAFKQLSTGDLDVSAAGLAFEDLLKTAKKENIEVADPAAYVATAIGASKIYTVSHKDNPVKSLSFDQLKGIFTGKIANWKEVGGNDAPILIVLSSINPATNAAYKKIALADAPFAADIVDAGRFEDVREKVAANPEAIAFGPVTMLDASIKTVQTPDVARPVILITKGAPTPKVQKLISFIKGEGQKFIKQ
ncbi:ABC transporter, periplasmic substrate-binding protein [Citrifermentans bemidjiense Bem]|uniref:ABC transporter, periplasmic substrate-binding protein n=1 Tax=Citrifermentans bemidjiense (strain ATCC BAA-1014 / DSM 16622 / JCM 12645 / Bem) TaxID=404380 RepID=B5ECY8_CITBB|nr:substrate-binding domain-containing protein [Citrifermentans bemidjiense]ACH40605.1 ABC transporter, periplasmic substrate-binding protein [Citrifermentans bemidjiense Bem]